MVLQVYYPRAEEHLKPAVLKEAAACFANKRPVFDIEVVCPIFLSCLNHKSIFRFKLKYSSIKFALKTAIYVAAGNATVPPISNNCLLAASATYKW